MPDRRWHLLWGSFLLVPWALLGHAVFEHGGRWDVEREDAAILLLLLWVPLVGVLLGLGWAACGAWWARARLDLLWYVPLILAAAAGQLVLAWFTFWFEVAPT